MMRHNVLVCGAGGFIGGHLAQALSADVVDVTAVDIKPISQWWQVNHNATNICADLADPAQCADVCRNQVVVFQLAANMGGIGQIERDRIGCMRNVLINANMLEAAYRAGVQRYFFSSSACVYNADKQSSTNLPALKESDAYPAMAERGYGWEKLYTEMLCREYTEERGMETRVARFHNIYGPHGSWTGGREKAPAAICRKVAEAKLAGHHAIDIWGDGSQLRSYCYVSDCLYGVMRLVESDFREPLNIGSSEAVSVNELVSKVEAIAGVKLERIYQPDAPKGVAGRNSDNTLIKQVLGWEPSTSLDVGLASTYRWIEEQVAGRSV